jgi:hypothetical protein
VITPELPRAPINAPLETAAAISLEIARPQILDLIPGGLQGQSHICACVAIGNGEYIQSIDNILVGAKPGQPGIDQALKDKAVNGFLAKFSTRAVSIAMNQRSPNPCH